MKDNILMIDLIQNICIIFLFLINRAIHVQIYLLSIFLNIFLADRYPLLLRYC